MVSTSWITDRLRSYSFQKACTYRAVSLATTLGISFLITGSIAKALSIGVVDQAFKFGIYLYHESWWTNRIRTKEQQELAAIDAAVFGDNSAEDDD